jgi:2'-5' RNA ligase
MAPPTAENIRAFVAIAIDAVLIAELKNVQQELRVKLPGELASWTKPEQIHLTLKFFGSVAKTDLPEVTEALHRACAGQPAFQLGLAGLGYFPTAKNPRVIWVGINGQLDSLLRLQANIEKELRGYGGHSEEQAFRPHLTIARVKAFGREGRRVGEIVEQTKVTSPGSWTVREVELMESRLEPYGARYSQLAAVPLAN